MEKHNKEKNKNKSLKKKWYKYERKNLLFYKETQDEETIYKNIEYIKETTDIFNTDHLIMYGIYFYKNNKDINNMKLNLTALLLISYDKSRKISESDIKILPGFIEQEYDSSSNDIFLLKCGFFPIKNSIYYKKDEIYNPFNKNINIEEEKKKIEDFINKRKYTK